MATPNKRIKIAGVVTVLLLSVATVMSATTSGPGRSAAPLAVLVLGVVVGASVVAYAAPKSRRRDRIVVLQELPHEVTAEEREKSAASTTTGAVEPEQTTPAGSD